MSQTASPQSTKLAAGVSIAISSLLEFDSPSLTPDQVRDALSDMCISMHIRSGELPRGIGLIWDTASTPDGGVFVTQIVIDALNRSVAEEGMKDQQ